jgi:hypothetical protein
MLTPRTHLRVVREVKSAGENGVFIQSHFLDSRSFFAWSGTLAHNLAPGQVNLGMDSTFMELSLVSLALQST